MKRLIASIFLGAAIVLAGAVTMMISSPQGNYGPSLSMGGTDRNVSPLPVRVAYLSIASNGDRSISLYDYTTGATTTISGSLKKCTRPRISRDGDGVAFFAEGNTTSTSTVLFPYYWTSRVGVQRVTPANSTTVVGGADYKTPPPGISDYVGGPYDGHHIVWTDLQLPVSGGDGEQYMDLSKGNGSLEAVSWSPSSRTSGTGLKDMLDRGLNGYSKSAPAPEFGMLDRFTRFSKSLTALPEMAFSPAGAGRLTSIQHILRDGIVASDDTGNAMQPDIDRAGDVWVCAQAGQGNSFNQIVRYPSKLVLTNVPPLANGDCAHPSIDGPGLEVAFDTTATNLSTLDFNARRDIYLVFINGTGMRMAYYDADTGSASSGDSSIPILSDSNVPPGYVVFQSSSQTLAPGMIYTDGGLGRIGPFAMIADATPYTFPTLPPTARMISVKDANHSYARNGELPGTTNFGDSLPKGTGFDSGDSDIIVGHGLTVPEVYLYL